MRYAVAAFALIHGICHLPGFAVPWRLMTTPELPYKTTILHDRVNLGDAGIRAWGLVWLMLGVAFLVLAAGVWLRSPWWLSAVSVVTLISLVCCLFMLPEAKFGVIANALLLTLTCVAIRYPGGRVPVGHAGLAEMWKSVPHAADAAFVPAAVPEAGRAHLVHAIAPGTALAGTARLRMHGEIKIGRWWPFTAEQVIDPHRGMVWTATVSMFGMPVRGADQVVDGEGAMRWRLFDLIPVAEAAGPDTTRSTLGRFAGETAAWLPSALCSRGQGLRQVDWVEPPAAGWNGRSVVRVDAFNERVEITLAHDANGRLRSVTFPRWGNPDGVAYRYVPFQVHIDEEREFQGYTVPSRVRAGWVGFDEGEFFRATVDAIEFR